MPQVFMRMAPAHLWQAHTESRPPAQTRPSARCQAYMPERPSGVNVWQVQRTCGITSPKSSTADTDSAMAAAGDSNRSINRGSASMAAALDSSSVTRSRCGRASTCTRTVAGDV